MLFRSQPEAVVDHFIAAGCQQRYFGSEAVCESDNSGLFGKQALVAVGFAELADSGPSQPAEIIPAFQDFGDVA